MIKLICIFAVVALAAAAPQYIEKQSEDLEKAQSVGLGYSGLGLNGHLYDGLGYNRLVYDGLKHNGYYGLGGIRYGGLGGVILAPSIPNYSTSGNVGPSYVGDIGFGSHVGYGHGWIY